MGWLAENPPSVGELFFGGGSGSTGTPPTITLNPASQSVDEYGNVTFTGAATGDEPITYQWYKNGSPVGTNSDSYTLTAAAADNGATVYFTATNASGSATSSTATLTVVSYRYVLDGSTQHHNTNQRLIDITSDIDVSVKLQHVAAITLYEAIFGQTQSTAVASTEFLVKLRDSGTIYVTVGGNTAAFVNKLPTSNISTVLRITLVGTSLKMYWDGALIETLSFTRGAVTEPAAVTRIGGVIVSGGGLVGFKGSTSKATINGTYLQLDNKALGENQMGDIASTIVNYNAANWVVV